MSVDGVSTEVQYRDIVEVDGSNFGTQSEHVEVSLVSQFAA